MSDQAETLRRLMQQRPQFSNTDTYTHSIQEIGQTRGVPVLTVSSGKGGVGKSCLSAHLGTLLARSGLRVMLVDGDFGLANLDIMLGVQPVATLEQVLAGEARLQDAVIGVEPNLWLVPAASGVMNVRQSDLPTRQRIARLFDDCPWEMDVIIMDVGAGIQSNVLSLHSPAFKSVIVLTPEPTSLTDAYGLIKTLCRNTAVAEFHVLVNRVTDAREAKATFQRLKDVADRFIDVRIEFLGHCERDEKITQAVMNRKILLDWNGSESGAVRSLRSLAMNVQEKFLEPTLAKNELERESDADLESSLSVGSLVGNTARFWRTLLVPDSVAIRTTRA